MRDIAKMAGVTQATVSRALRNHPSIPPATCHKIQTLAKQVGYQSDPVLSALISYRWTNPAPVFTYRGILAWFDNSPTQRQFTEKIEFKSVLFASARKRAKELGYDLEPFWLRDPKISKERLLRILKARNIKGIIVGSQPSIRVRLQFNWSAFSVVTLGHTLVDPGFHRVSNDPVNAMSLIMQKLRARGYRRVGLAMPMYWNARVDYHWEAGFLLQQQRAHHSDRIPPLLMENFEEGPFLNWFKRFTPQAVITDPYSPVPEWLNKIGVRVPEDVGLVYPNILKDDQKRLSGLMSSNDLIASAAIDMVVGMIYRNEKGIPQYPQCLHIPSSWINGKTIRTLSRPRAKA
jgi:LacI family transcriptional regulator